MTGELLVTLDGEMPYVLMQRKRGGWPQSPFTMYSRAHESICAICQFSVWSNSLKEKIHLGGPDLGPDFISWGQG